MNINAFELPTTDAHSAAIDTALEAVANLVNVAAGALSPEARTHLQALLRSGAQLEVHFRLEHGKTAIQATIEDTLFFTIDLGSGMKEETRH